MRADVEALVTIDFTSFPMPPGPWMRGRAEVSVEEQPINEHWSAYRILGGKVLTVMPAIGARTSGPVALLVLWRAVANATRVCPICHVRATMEGTTGIMEHESSCPITDASVGRASRELATASPLPAELPAAPRIWIVRPPVLAIRQKGRRGRR